MGWQMTTEKYRHIVQVCRGKVRKVKDHLQLNLKRDVKGNKKDSYRSISSKRKGSVDLQLNGGRGWHSCGISSFSKANLAKKNGLILLFWTSELN